LAVRLTLAFLALAVLLMPAAARADGDPASDVLYLQDVYLPYQQPSPAAAADLRAAVADATDSGYRTKVAVIASFEDLGLVSSLFGRPQAYARFLGAEIRSFYTGHLIVVMPQGFGVWFDRFDVGPQQAILSQAQIASPGPDGLTHAAAAAIRLLVKQDHARPRSTDTLPPDVQAIAAKAKRGSVARLRYVVSDDSGRSREEVRVYGPKFALLAVIRDPLERADGRADEVRWKIPRSTKPQHLRFCVVGIDAAGNQSRASCARFDVI
jgi:hypothetical protein